MGEQELIRRGTTVRVRKSVYAAAQKQADQKGCTSRYLCEDLIRQGLGLPSQADIGLIDKPGPKPKAVVDVDDNDSKNREPCPYCANSKNTYTPESLQKHMESFHNIIPSTIINEDVIQAEIIDD